VNLRKFTCENYDVKSRRNAPLSKQWKQLRQGSAAFALIRVTPSSLYIDGERTQLLYSDVIIFISLFRTGHIPFNSHTLVDWRNIMDPIRKQQLIRQRTVAKSSLTRMQTLIETDLITFLESRCKALELLQTTQSMKASTTTPCSSRPPGGKVSNLVYCNVATQLQCLLCSGSHRLFHCDTFLNWKPSSATICQAITTLFQLIATLY